MKHLVILLAALASFNALADTPEEHAAEQARLAQEEEHKKQVEREWAEQYAKEQAAAKKYREDDAQEEAALKRQCGKDYMSLRVGMKIKRVEKCLGATYETDTVTQKGAVETWRSAHDWIYVQNGVVTGYTKRTD